MFMVRCVGTLLATALLVGVAGATALDDYVSAPDPNYSWRDTGANFKTVFGGTAHVLNVTSQRWLDTSKAYGPDGDLWTHQVVVIVPKKLKVQNLGMTYLTGNCNKNPSVPTATDEDILVVDTVAATTGVIGIVVFQLPNCPIVYPSDPSKRGRTEDAMIAWAWHEFLQDKDATWLPRLPMTKAAMQCMKAVTEFTAQQKLAALDGFVVAGASKRGWTTWTVGAVTCPSCVKILGIAPLVPIVPSLIKEMHRMWQAYGGWTFAFSDYMDVNLTAHVDDPVFKEALQVIDPMYYYDRLERLPKLAVLSSDDEFMMMDWTNIWYDEMKGETHLLIAPNSEHSLATGIPEVLNTLSTFVSSIAQGKTNRPQFKYSHSSADGQLTVTIPSSFPPSKVLLRHAQTLQKERRDFRWVRLANNDTGLCTLPDIKLPSPIFGGNCIQPIGWGATPLQQHNTTTEGDLVYTYTPPKDGKNWQGYYIEMLWPSDTDLPSNFFRFTTPGFTWPDSLPFPDCHGEACRGHIL
mmetsp:Transcript_23111/g.32621  ORF Transcript_23111/g.32621 Transcript_23111/m.32621 type:complete len:520 (-) Transcript_23111:242-1801(-)